LFFGFVLLEWSVVLLVLLVVLRCTTALEFLGLLHVANNRVEEGLVLYSTLLRLLGTKTTRNPRQQQQWDSIQQRITTRIKHTQHNQHTQHTQHNQHNQHTQQQTPQHEETTTHTQQVSGVHRSRVELCEGLLPSVRLDWLSKGEHMTLDDDEVVRGQIFIVSSHEMRFFPIETLSFD